MASLGVSIPACGTCLLARQRQVDTHVRTYGVVSAQEGLVPGVQPCLCGTLRQVQVVSGSALQPKEEPLLIPAEAALNRRIVIGRTLVNVEVLQPHLLTLGVKALLELQAVVRLCVTHREGQGPGGVVQGKRRLPEAYLVRPKPGGNCRDYVLIGTLT